MSNTAPLRAGERRVTFITPRSLARALDAAADRAGLSRASFVRHALTTHLRASGALPGHAVAAPGHGRAED